MASPENIDRSFGEKAGYIARNVGIVLAAGAIFAPQYLGLIFIPSVGLAVGGEVLGRASKSRNE
jgi:hypothetical protein